MRPSQGSHLICQERILLYYRSLTIQLLFNGHNIAAQAVVSFYLVGYLFNGIHHSGMVAATQHCADLWEGEIRFLAQDIHGDLSWQGHISRTVAAEQIGRAHV